MHLKHACSDVATSGAHHAAVHCCHAHTTQRLRSILSACAKAIVFTDMLIYNKLRVFMVGGLKKMRAVKVARRRRDLSPDLYYYAVHAALAKIQWRSYQLRTTITVRGDPSVHVVLLLPRTTAIGAAVAILLHEIEEFGNVQLFVTCSSSKFYSMCSMLQ